MRVRSAMYRLALEGESVGSVQSGRNDFDAAFAIVLHDRIHLVEQRVADEQGSLIPGRLVPALEMPLT